MANIVLFPGQGSQKEGMGQAFLAEFQDLILTADAVLGYSVADLCINNPDGKLNQTEYTQPTLYVVNALSFLKAQKKATESVDFLAGHSLGEYNALFAAGVFDFQTGLRLVQKRAQLMATISGGGMAAVRGLSVSEIEPLLEDFNITSVDITNINTPNQIVLAGPTSALKSLEEPISRRGGFLVLLNVSGPFHSRYMQPIQHEFESFLTHFEFKTPATPVISNVTARPYGSGDIRRNLVEQLCRPVRWLESMEFLLGQSQPCFEEVGPGRVLTRMLEEIRSSRSKTRVPRPSKCGTKETLVDIGQRRVATQADSLAFRFLEKGEISGPVHTWTCAELDHRAKTIAAHLQVEVPAGERILLLHPPGLDFISAFYGCLCGGYVAVPAMPPDPTRSAVTLSRLQTIVKDVQPYRIMTTAPIAQLLVEGYAGEALSSYDIVASDTLDTSGQPAWKFPEITSDNLAFIQYTSGSTSHPKGVMVSHGNLLSNLSQIASTFGHHRKVASWLPLSHDLGLISMLYVIYIGGQETLMSPLHFLQRPMRWLEMISHYGSEAASGPNFAYDLCVKKSTEAERSALDLSGWQYALNGSENVRAATIDRFCDAFACSGFQRKSFSPCYGLAESTLLSCGVEQKDEPYVLSVDNAALQRNVVALTNSAQQAYTVVSIGFPPSGSMILIVDPETKKRCGERIIGEIWINSTSVAQGYWQNDEMTEQIFNAHLASGDGPFLRTGDLGFIHEGQLFVTGRIKDMIIIRGRNIYPQDIESSIEKNISALRLGCSVAFSVDVRNEERLVVVAEVRNEKDIDVAACTRMIRNTILIEQEISPHAVVLVRPRTIPKTTSGKHQRRACRERYLKGELDVISCESDAPPDLNDVGAIAESEEKYDVQDTVTWLIHQVAAIRNIDPSEIDPEMDFQHLGLESIDMVELSGRLETRTGQSLTPTIAYSYPRIKSLAEFLTGETPGTSNGKQLSITPDEAIAIVGVGCRFPKAHGPEAFWRLLENGVDAVQNMPSDRWDADKLSNAALDVPDHGYMDYAGVIDDVDKFDAGFFNISSREAETMDPQQRLLLEVSWEALENAGVDPTGLNGSKTGVYIGMSSHDYANRHLFSGRHALINAFSGTGVAHSTSVGRIAYTLGLRGPSVAIDTACSSSLVAVHNAAQALRTGDCNLALAGGVNLILSPELSIYLNKTGALTRTGKCRAFDAKADGYVRGEGCGIIVMKRMSEAQRDGDNILAVILGSAVNQDGRTNGLTAPNGESQRQLINDALINAGITPGDVSYIEAHGTGTVLGDPIEAHALDACFKRNSDNNLLVGSVKTNIGHLEAAAGIAGLIKVVLALKEKRIPANLHFTSPNPNIDWESIGITIPTTTQSWEQKRRIAGVSSFGFGGTNAHVIIENYAHDTQAALPTSVSPAGIITLSARTQPQLEQQIEQLMAFILNAQHQNKELDMQALAYTLQCGRAAFKHRAAIVATSIQMLIGKLECLLTGKKSIGIYLSQPQANTDEFDLLCKKHMAARAFTSKLLEQGCYDLVAKLWVGGVSVDWSALYKKNRPAILQMPTYPFARERYWMDAPSPVTQPNQEQFHYEKLKSLPAKDLLVHLVHRLAKIDYEQIGLDKSFAAIGIDSLMAMELLTSIERVTGVRIFFSDLNKKLNLTTLAELIESRRNRGIRDIYPELEVMQEGAGLLPVFWFHGGFGTIQPYIPLVRAIGGDLPFYAIQARGMRTDTEPIRDLMEMAKYYTEILLHKHPEGDFQLGGYSHGGRVAYEVARQLQIRGRCVKNIVMIDSAYPIEVKTNERLQYIISFFNVLKTAGVCVDRTEMKKLLSSADLVSALSECGVNKGLPYTKDELKSLLHRMATILEANLFACNKYKEQIKELSDPQTPELYYFQRKSQELSYGPFLGNTIPKEGEIAEALRNLNKTFDRDEVSLWRKVLPRLSAIKTPSEDHMTMFDDAATIKVIVAKCKEIYGVKPVGQARKAVHVIELSLNSAHPEMANLSDIGVARKI